MDLMAATLRFPLADLSTMMRERRPVTRKTGHFDDGVGRNEVLP
jgi:hypothetical protein